MGNGCSPREVYPVRYPGGTAGAPTNPGAERVIPYGCPVYPGHVDGPGRGTNDPERVVSEEIIPDEADSTSVILRALLRRRVARFGAGGAKARAE